MRNPLPKIGILGSGNGSNFSAIARAIGESRLSAEIVLVISDNPVAGILQKARALNLPALALPTSKFRTKLEAEIEQYAVDKLLEAGAEWIVLAGYMRLIKAPLLKQFESRILNIHPSLLPSFPGLEAWKQALEAKVPRTGCTVHWVDAGMDTGTIIAQSEVPVLEDDTAASLHARIQVAEHSLYPAVLQRILHPQQDS
ncbi:MAG: phosphoribosylglycinamide formyltransferase [Verrucomicrobiota bacterium]